MWVRIIISKHGLNPVCLLLIFSLVGAEAQCDTWHWEYHCHQIWVARYWLAHMIPLVSVLNGNPGEKQTMENTKNVSYIFPSTGATLHFLRLSFTNQRKEIALSWAGEIFLLLVGKTSEHRPVLTQMKYPVSGSQDDVPGSANHHHH